MDDNTIDIKMSDAQFAAMSADKDDTFAKSHSQEVLQLREICARFDPTRTCSIMPLSSWEIKYGWQ